MKLFFYILIPGVIVLFVNTLLTVVFYEKKYHNIRKDDWHCSLTVEETSYKDVGWSSFGGDGYKNTTIPLSTKTHVCLQYTRDGIQIGGMK